MSKEVKNLLVSLEDELRRLNRWQGMPPSPEAMNSTVPFCMDSMAFTQWLQWLFIPRVQAILDQGGELPKGANIKPYAEEALQVEQIETVELLQLIEAFDRVMN